MVVLRASILAGAVGVGVVGTSIAYNSFKAEPPSTLGERKQPWFDQAATPPPRAQQIASLKLSGLQEGELFDLLIIGAGSVGSGAALDAATRGLRVALVERDDFAGATSSRSTKLIHGGVRYLEKAIKQFDSTQLHLVFEALHERKKFLNNFPHLTHPIPILTPMYHWFQVPYYWMGLKMYDILAGTAALTWSNFLSASESKRIFPTLAIEMADRSRLAGAVVYHDGQMDDARVAVSMVTTSALAGATVANHCEVVKLLTDKDGKTAGAVVKDNLSGEEFPVRARITMNTTGPYCDVLRQMAVKDTPTIIKPSSGVHVTLPDYYSPEGMGLIVPKTKDGRVVFMLPWMGATIAGTTDRAVDLQRTPQATQDEVDFILDSISDFLTVKVRRQDVLSVWAGIRPLAADPNKVGGTENLVRDHVIATDASGMITVTGGKWTTYRRMAEDAVDAAVKAGDLKVTGPCRTQGLPVVGAFGWHPAFHTVIAQRYQPPHRPGAIDTRVAHYLSHSYGDRAMNITKIAEEKNMGQRLVRGHPMIEAEVVYAARNEYCLTAAGFLAHRTRLAFLDVAAADRAAKRVVELLGEEFGWDAKRQAKELEDTKKFLKTFTVGDNLQPQRIAGPPRQF